MVYSQTATGTLRQQQRSFKWMVGGEHAAVRHARAPVLELDHAADLGGERFADRVEQPGKRRVVGRLSRPRMRRADLADFR